MRSQAHKHAATVGRVRPSRERRTKQTARHDIFCVTFRAFSCTERGASFKLVSLSVGPSLWQHSPHYGVGLAKGKDPTLGGASLKFVTVHLHCLTPFDFEMPPISEECNVIQLAAWPCVLLGLCFALFRIAMSLYVVA